MLNGFAPDAKDRREHCFTVEFATADDSMKMGMVMPGIR